LLVIASPYVLFSVRVQ